MAIKIRTAWSSGNTLSVRTRNFGEVSLYFACINNRFRLAVIRESMILESWTFAVFDFFLENSETRVDQGLRGRLFLLN